MGKLNDFYFKKEFSEKYKHKYDKFLSHYGYIIFNLFIMILLLSSIDYKISGFEIAISMVFFILLWSKYLSLLLLWSNSNMNRLIVASDNRKMQKKKSYREPLEESIIITIFIFLFVMADVTFLISLLKSSNPSVGMLVLLFLVYLELIMIRRVIDIEELRLWILKRIDLLFLLVFFVFLKVVVYSEIVDIVSDKFTSVLLLMSIYSLYRLVILTYHLVNNSDFNRSFLKIALLFVFLFVLFIDTSATLNILIYNSDNITSFKGLSLTNDNQIFDLYYYTVINITSVGFGDITPLSQDARFLSIVTSILGYLTFASFLAIALTNFSSKKNENDIEYKEEESILK